MRRSVLCVDQAGMSSIALTIHFPIKGSRDEYLAALERSAVARERNGDHVAASSIRAMAAALRE
jgi:hypothetical protein